MFCSLTSGTTDFTIVCHSITGSPSAFQKVYEQPIVLSQQPEATQVEREIGEMRGKEVNIHFQRFLVS